VLSKLCRGPCITRYYTAQLMTCFSLSVLAVLQSSNVKRPVNELKRLKFEM